MIDMQLKQMVNITLLLILFCTIAIIDESFIKFDRPDFIWLLLLQIVDVISDIVITILLVIIIMSFFNSNLDKPLYKFKRITRDEQGFLYRFTIYTTHGSIKIHFFNRSDNEKPHNHPWNFKSLLIIPYKEELFSGTESSEHPYYIKKHSWLSIVNRDSRVFHRVKLYKLFGINIPALTVGYYSDKIEDWDFSKDMV